MPARRLRARYAGTCAVCAEAVEIGDSVWWDSDARTLRCLACGDGDPAPSGRGVAGGSAQREADRRSSLREQRVRSAHPRIGGLLLAVFEDPQSTRAWAEGAEGERKVAARLDELGEGAVILHDRRIPGRRTNIDHIVISPCGVWVVDAKRYRGRIERRDLGGWRRSDERLFVAGRDRSNLVEGIRALGEVVGRAIGDPDPPVRLALCFVDADWAFFARPFEIDGVLVTWHKALVSAIRNPGPPAGAMREIAERMIRSFPPA